MEHSSTAPIHVPEQDERGATAVEYGLMVALISIAILVAVTAFGSSVRELFELIPPAVWQG